MSARSLVAWRLRGPIVFVAIPALTCGASFTSASDASDAHSSVRLEASEIPEGATKYSVLIRGVPRGVLGSWQTGNNAWRYHFEYNERGRGPWIDETLVLNAELVPVLIQVRGHDFFGRPVTEDYSLVGSGASWIKGGKKGAQRLAGTAFYVSTPVVAGQLSAVPEELAALARALLATSDHELPLVPPGEVRLESFGRTQIHMVDATRTVNAMRIQVSGSGAAMLWLDDDDMLFAILEGSMALIRRGWEAALPAIESRVEALP